MKNKLPLIFCTFFLFCSISLQVNAQKQKVKNNIFDLEIVNYSDKPDADIEHYHLLQLTNNSNTLQELELIINTINCKGAYNNIVKNKKGIVDYINEDLSKKKNNKNDSSLMFEIYNKTLSKSLNKVSLQPKESVEFYLKITRQNNSEIGQWKCSKLIAKLLNNNTTKSVIIKSFIPDSNLKGH